ncbi:DUF262 domain-containing protein [Flavobacterium terrigena]|uniref:Uncharacterized conserved protein, contains ParB-like and HNH nuclease domains n=1 Tax=Flavobacterium terrigena TaxID=402734 RepID=A0A1H6T451_9FLAO|nr:DUF262 domain-containing protein [Flavobacterium terrigena]SEI71050.1 Uncharacterized conserved protein, contains ParB-like and HNH nuclease domains [Flavobacterium terrigena]
MINPEESLQSINDLIGEKFHIPNYQRGYRWGKTQVEELLNDIWDFTQDRTKDEIYCLQPIVIKKNDDTWELIDGQQRMTTIFLILKHLKHLIDGDINNIEIVYQTRKGSEDFLSNINEKDKEVNIDFFHIFNANDYIEKWFASKANNGIRNVKTIFINPFLDNTKVIWYEVEKHANSIDIFTKLNIGKIPLTNAELIKALFLSNSNNSINEEKQFEISNDWDNIEYKLSNENFWYFLNQNLNDINPRIDFLFDIINTDVSYSSYSSFHFYNEKIKDEGTSVVSLWNDVKTLFLTLEEWYNDREIFHLIGFLINEGENIESILKNFKSKKKKDFINYLKSKVLKLMIEIDFSEISYGKKDYSQIKRTLLLFNIITIVKNKESNIKFQFDRYKKEKWDIEHIHSTKENMPSTSDVQKDWLKSLSEYLESKEDFKLLFDEISGFDFLEKTPEEFELLYNKVISIFTDEGDNEYNKNGLSNLTLLDANTNRSYKNAIFPIKRNTIIKKDLEGVFIPTCTKNVFLKYYSTNVSQMNFWGGNDRKDYFTNIVNTITDYIGINES